MWVIPKNLSIYRSAQDMGALISDSQELSDQLGQSVLWRSKPSASKTWSRRLKVGGSTQRLYSQTLKNSLGSPLVEEWTSSLEASLVSHFQQQGEEQETKTQDICGLTSQTESNDWEDLPLFCLKTSKASSAVSSRATIGVTQKAHRFCSMSSESWKDWVTTRRREYSQRVKSVRPISESEHSSWVCVPTSGNQDAILFLQCSEIHNESTAWATPTLGALEAPSGGSPNDQEATYRLQNQVQPTPHQEAQTHINGNQRALQWATPTAMEGGKIGNNPNGNKGQRGLSNDPLLHKPWATPTAREHKNACLVKPISPRRDGRTRLDTMAAQIHHQELQNWTTPISRDCYEIEMNRQIPDRKDGKTRLDTMPRQVHHQQGYKGKLNPRWVETLMGLPVGWVMPSCATLWIIAPTSLDCSETELCQAQPSEHSESYGVAWKSPIASDAEGGVLKFVKGSTGKYKLRDQVTWNNNGEPR